MSAEAILILRPLSPGDASRRVCPLQQILGLAGTASSGERRSDRREFGVRKRADRSRPSPAQPATKSVDGTNLGMAIHDVFRPLLSVPDQS